MIRPRGAVMVLVAVISCSAASAYLAVQDRLERGTTPRGSRSRRFACINTVTSESTLERDDDTDTSTRTRRHFLKGATMRSSGFLVGMLSFQQASCAKYGASSNMELPNYIEYLVEKNSQGASTASIALYKGADPVVLLRRLQEANNRLNDIPTLAKERKWSQVQGLLTGPLGTLSQTLNQIATPDSDKQVQAVSKKLKADLIDIGQAAAKKNAEDCSAKAEDASKDLVSFLEMAFD
jgi:hypothetical protein